MKNEGYEVVTITDNEGNSQTFSSLSKLIDYANTCGSMSWLPDDYTWTVNYYEGKRK